MTTAMEAVRAVLVADAPVAALVGSKIYANRAPQNAIAPFIVCRVISDVPESSLDADSDSTLGNVRLQVDSYAATYLGAKAVGVAVNAVLRALISPSLSCWRVGGRDLWDDVAQLHNDSADFSVWRASV